MDYPYPSCTHGAVRGYCDLCRGDAFDFLVRLLLDAQVSMPAVPADLAPALNQSLDRVSDPAAPSI